MKIVRHIPNAITCCNLLCGCLALMSAFAGNFEGVLLWILGAAFFDFFDGMSARLLKAYSPVGKELDSLADMVSFGVAPAIASVYFMKPLTGCALLVYVPLIIAPLSALRLAKFNIDDRQAENFIGLATPACALTVASMLATVSSCKRVLMTFVSGNPWVIPAVCVALALLLTSGVPMFSMKFKSLSPRDNSARYIFLGIVLCTAVTLAAAGAGYALIIFSVFAIYLIMNLFLAVRKISVKKV